MLAHWQAGEFAIDFDEDTPEVEAATPSEGRARPDQLRRVIRWFRDLARALGHVHDHRVLHRDIKPSNIMIQESGAPYLIDFGVGASDHNHGGAIVVGTLPYMSPEQAAAGLPGIDRRSDLYSLGVTFYEAVTGRRAVRSHTEKAIIQDILHGTIPPPSHTRSDIPKTLDPIFAHVLRRDPAYRYANGHELTEDLDRWLSGRRPIHAPETLAQRIHRRRFWILAGAAMAITIGGVILWLMSGPPSEYAEIRAFLREGRHDAALELCRSTAAEHHDDPIHRDLYARADNEGAPGRIERILGHFGNVLSGPDLDCTVTRLCYRSAAHLPWRPDSASLRFEAALGHRLRLDNAGALHRLAKPGSGSVLEEQLRALILLAQAGDRNRPTRQRRAAIDAYRSTVADLAKRRESEGPARWCLEAWRLVNEVLVTATSDQPKLFRQAELLVERITERDRGGHYRVATTLKARILLEQRKFTDARKEYAILAESRPNALFADNAAAVFLLAVSSLLEAVQSEPADEDRWNSGVDTIERLARSAPKIQRRALDMVARLDARRMVAHWSLVVASDVLGKAACSKRTVDHVAEACVLLRDHEFGGRQWVECSGTELRRGRAVLDVAVDWAHAHASPRQRDGSKNSFVPAALIERLYCLSALEVVAGSSQRADIAAALAGHAKAAAGIGRPAEQYQAALFHLQGDVAAASVRKPKSDSVVRALHSRREELTQRLASAVAHIDDEHRAHARKEFQKQLDDLKERTLQLEIPR